MQELTRRPSMRSIAWQLRLSTSPSMKSQSQAPLCRTPCQVLRSSASTCESWESVRTIKSSAMITWACLRWLERPGCSDTSALPMSESWVEAYKSGSKRVDPYTLAPTLREKVYRKSRQITLITQLWISPHWSLTYQKFTLSLVTYLHRKQNRRNLTGKSWTHDLKPTSKEKSRKKPSTQDISRGLKMSPSSI